MCKQTRTKAHTICDTELGNNPDQGGFVETTEYHNNIGQSVDILCYASE
jgi:hypothetical protein